MSSSANLMCSAFSGPYVGNNGQGAGNVRYNTMTQQMEVFDGSVWVSISVDANLSLSYGAEETIRWAQDKMREEEELRKLAENNQTVKIALDNLVKAQEQLKIAAHLAKEPA